MNEELPFCECGCGERVANRGNRFLRGHQFRGKHHTIKAKKKIVTAKTGVSLPPEHCAAISTAKMGHEVSEDTRKTISEANINSDANKAQIESMRDGNDFVWHHVAYDFGRPDDLRVRITRKFHGQIHHPKGCSFSERCYSLID